MSHVDRLFYCGCKCGCTDVVASELHRRCVFCRTLHTKKYPQESEKKEIKL